MRPWPLMFFLFLSILIHHAQGIRLRKSSVPAGRQQSLHEQLQGKRSEIEGVEDAVLCTSKQCSGRIRKLTMIHNSSTTTTAKNDKNEAFSSTNQKIGRKEENLSVNSSSEIHQGRTTSEPSPDIIDIAGMDYSLQARRKPPIHN